MFCSRIFKFFGKSFLKHLNNTHPHSSTKLSLNDLNATINYNSKSCVDDVINSKIKNSQFSFLHLNINSLSNHLIEISYLLNSKVFDIIFLSETKLDETLPFSYFINLYYDLIRRDRNSFGGGLAVFIKKPLKCNSVVTYNSEIDFEFIYFQITYLKKIINFIFCYKAPILNDKIFIDYLENLLFKINLDEDIFIIGDLNMDLNIFKQNINFSEFIINYGMKNFITESTRINTSKTDTTEVVSESLIDIILHNSDLITNTSVYPCSFSDHSFIIAGLNFTKVKDNNFFSMSRCLNANKLNMIMPYIISIDFNALTDIKCCNLRWLSIKSMILNILNEFAPFKRIKPYIRNYCPWMDDELLEIRQYRDNLYRIYLNSKSSNDRNNFIAYRKLFFSLQNAKMIYFFRDKSLSDFKSSKKFWNFYSSYIKIKSDKTCNSLPSLIRNGNISADEPVLISNMFNNFFSSLSSTSNSSFNDCIEFSNIIFSKLLSEKKLSPNKFSFHSTTESIVKKTIKSLSSTSSPGASDIPITVFKTDPTLDSILETSSFIKCLTDLFNECINTCSFPDEWKSAIVTPLHKGKKLCLDDINNYRGISVLPPIAKTFEKILATQIILYMNSNNLFYESQYGFRSAHSCETALHDFISRMNEIRSNREFGMCLFIDFRKAFDLVDSKILLNKLKWYGFDSLSCNLINNYFSNRRQVVKFNNTMSSSNEINLGVPQGSVLGPLFFLIFINDLPFYLHEFYSILFADDTTLCFNSKNYDDLLGQFFSACNKLIDWCKSNRTDINWLKTEIMFISRKMEVNELGKKRLFRFPSTIRIHNNEVKVVDSFKLLGIIIDNKLNFKKYASHLRITVNRRLYSIKRLFYLSFPVKLQFFKSFILPHFDYCNSLYIYFPKSTIQKICNCYYLCLQRLLNLKFSNTSEFNCINNDLFVYNLESLQHRVLRKLLIFSYKILYSNEAPKNLKNKLVYNYNLNRNQSLRNDFLLAIPFTTSQNKYYEKTFDYFFPKFINIFSCLLLLNSDSSTLISFSLLKTSVFNNVNLFFEKFLNFSPQFDVKFVFL